MIQRHRGQVVNGEDGVFATFDGPARAIRVAAAIIAEAACEQPCEAGLHCGECEVVGHDLRGVAVYIARQMAQLAPTGRVLVSQTIRDLIVGTEISLDEHGSQELDGVSRVVEHLPGCQPVSGCASTVARR